MRALAFLLALMFAPLAGAQADDPVANAAAPFARLHDVVGESIAAPIASQAEMDALLAGASFEPAAMARGYIAYGALAAAQSPAFARGLQSRVRAAGRAPVLRQLRRDLTYARRRPPGGADAIQYALNAIADERTRFQTAAARFERFTPPGWPALTNEQRRTRDDDLRTLASRPRAAPLQFAFTADARLRERADRADTLNRMLTLAGLTILNAADDQPRHTSGLLDDPRAHACLQMAQLQFRQCISVSQGGDEDAACLARHGLREPASCIAAPLR